MSMNMRLKYCVANLFVAVIVCGCQSPLSKWGMASVDRDNPSSKIQKNSDVRSTRTGNLASGNAKKSGSKDEVSVKPAENTKQIVNLMEQGDQLRKSGQYDEARSVYNNALAISPGDADLHHRLAIIADKQQKYSVADEHYQSALRARPNDVNLLSDLGYSYSLRGNSEKAEKTLKQALSIDPTHRGALANLGTIYAQQNRYPDALAIFRKGSASEAEAKQSVAKLFSRASRTTPQQWENLANNQSDMDSSDRRKSIEGRGSHEFSSANSTKGDFDTDLDLSSLSNDQLKAELARRDRPVEQGRTRGKSWDDPESEPDRSNPIQEARVRNAARNSESEMTSRVAMSDPARGKSDSQVLQAKGQTHDLGTGNIQQTGGKSNLSLMATRIGMNSGPGNLFPILSFKNEEMDSSVAQIPSRPSPAPAAGTAHWRDNLQNSASWDSDTHHAGGSGQGFDSNDRSPLESDRPFNDRREKSDGMESRSVATKKGGIDGARPFNGAWPQSNETPNRQIQSPLFNGNERAVGGFDNFSANLNRNAPVNEPRLPKIEIPGGSPAQWPDAPN